MPEGRRRPQVASFEDCDSDESSVRPGTRVEARKQAPSLKRPGPPDAASDSGYSSHTSGNVASNGLVPLQMHSTAHATVPTRPRPTIHQNGSQQNTQQRLPTRSASVSRQQAPNLERRFTLQSQTQYQPSKSQPQPQHQRQQSYPTQYPVQDPPTYQQQVPAYQYAQTYSSQAIPVANGQPQLSHQRASSTTRPRPMSWANGPYNLPQGYVYGSTPPQGYAPAAHGPPPSPAAYHAPPQHPDWALYQRQQQAQALAALQLGSTPPISPAAAYMPPSPRDPVGQTSNPMAPPNGQLNEFNTRRMSTSYQNYERPAVPISQAPKESSEAFSTRTMPGSFPGPVAVSDESESDSGSSSCSTCTDDSEYERRERRKERARRNSRGQHDHHHHHRQRRSKSREVERSRHHDRASMPPPPRPSLKSVKTTPAVSHHSSREPLRRGPRSDTAFNYVPSDNVDYERTRPVIIRHATHSSTNSRHSSRGPSIFSSSSGRTPGTEYSSESRPARYIVEDPNGNRRAYYSREEAESTARRLQQKQQQLEDKILAYQQNTNGSLSPEITLDNIKRSQQKASRPSSSRVSGSSKKSESSSKLSKTDTSFQIKTGDTVFQINGNAKIEVRQNEEGAHVFTIGSASGREDKYYATSSRSSGSRMGRSRHGSDLGRGRRKDTIHEEDGYEPGY